MFFPNSRFKLPKRSFKSLIAIKNIIYITFIIFLQKKKKKIRHVKVLPKVVIVCFRKKAKFDCKNNYECSKLPNF